MKPILSKSILKQSMRDYWKFWLMLTGICVMFMLMITVFSPFAGEEINFPEGFTILNLLTNAFFQGAGMTLILSYAFVTANRLVAHEVDRGTMSFILNTPTTRRQIIFSKALFLLTSVMAMAFVSGISATIGIVMVGIDVDMTQLWTIIIGFVLFMMATAGISFMASCWFNRTMWSLLFGAGLPFAFFIISSIAQIGDLAFLQFFSLNSLFRADAVADGYAIQYWLPHFIALFVLAIGLFTGGIIKFLRKDLPL